MPGILYKREIHFFGFCCLLFNCLKTDRTRVKSIKDGIFKSLAAYVTFCLIFNIFLVKPSSNLIYTLRFVSVMTETVKIGITFSGLVRSKHFACQRSLL